MYNWIVTCNWTCHSYYGTLEKQCAALLEVASLVREISSYGNCCRGYVVFPITKPIGLILYFHVLYNFEKQRLMYADLYRKQQID